MFEERLTAESLRASKARAKRLHAEQPDYDRVAYNYGWYFAARGKTAKLVNNFGPIERAPEWWDGYFDYCSGRSKWYIPLNADAYVNSRQLERDNAMYVEVN